MLITVNIFSFGQPLKRANIFCLHMKQEAHFVKLGFLKQNPMGLRNVPLL